MRWLFRDFIFVIGLLIMAAAAIVTGVGIDFDVKELRDETIRWGVTTEELTFIILAASFFLVAGRLLVRLKRTEDARQVAVAAVAAASNELSSGGVASGILSIEAHESHLGYHTTDGAYRGFSIDDDTDVFCLQVTVIFNAIPTVSFESIRVRIGFDEFDSNWTPSEVMGGHHQYAYFNLVPAPKPGPYKAQLMASTDKGVIRSEPFAVEIPKP